MPKTAFALLVAAGCAFAAPAHAQTQSQMSEAADRDAKAADFALNAEYAAAMARLSTTSRTLLRDAQRSWIAFRDKECAFEASGVEGGSIHPMIVSQCLQRLTEDRTRQIREKTDCEEGDLSCAR